jgi:hypothetical protein
MICIKEFQVVTFFSTFNKAVIFILEYLSPNCLIRKDFITLILRHAILNLNLNH